jgi:AcrR family transcriptional regulator
MPVMSRPLLSRENAVVTATRMLDQQGAAALTMRGLAREMGVPLMSLYRHVESRDDLEAAIVEYLMNSIPRQPRTRSWEKAIRGWARAYRAMVRRHPNAAPLLASRPAAGYGARAEDAESMLASMIDAGLTPDQARVHMRAVLVTITGFCNTQAQAEQVDEAGLPEPPADEYPHLAALVDDVRARRSGDRVFNAMVDSVVAGLQRSMPGADPPP